MPLQMAVRIKLYSSIMQISQQQHGFRIKY